MEFFEIKPWLEVGVRWVHVFAAILWIGQTYLFHFFERNIELDDSGDSSQGTLWMVHGGGYYFLEKQAFHGPLPKTLHWFKWEAAVTWLSGIVLITLTFYLGGLEGLDQEYMPAALAGVGSIFGGWVVYTLLVRSPLGDNMPAFAAVGLAILLATHHGLYQVMTSRAAFLHIGAIMGTIMAANVWMKILPAQRKILAAVAEGVKPDADLLRVAPARSKHNSYMVVPLVFIMIGNHYPTISYGHDHSTMILGCFLIVGWVAAGFLLRKKTA